MALQLGAFQSGAFQDGATFRIELVGYVSGTSNGSAITLDLTALTGGIGTAAQENDIVIFAHMNRDGLGAGDKDVGTTTAGYTEIADLIGADSQYAHLSVNWKRMGSTPDTSVSSNNLTARNICIAYVLRNVDTTTALDVTSTTANLGDSGIANPPSITPTTAESLVVAVGAGMSASTTNPTGPSGYTHQITVNDPTAPSNYPYLGIAAKYWTSGAENPPAWTGVTDDVSYGWAAVTLALRLQQAASGALTLTVTSSAVTLTGSSVNVTVSRAVAVTSSAVTLTGSSVNVRVSRSIAVATAAVTLTGSSVTLQATKVLSVTSSAVTLTGSSVSVRVSRLVSVVSSAVTLTGSSVDLTVTPAGSTSFTLTVDSAAITLTGSSVTMTVTEAPEAPCGIFDTGIFDIGIFDHCPDAFVLTPAPAGGGYWPNLKRPEYRIHPEYDDPKPEKRKVKRIKVGNQVILESDDVTVQTGIIEVKPAWDVLVELQQQRDEAERAMQERLRAIALADDEWLMMA